MTGEKSRESMLKDAHPRHHCSLGARDSIFLFSLKGISDRVFDGSNYSCAPVLGTLVHFLVKFRLIANPTWIYSSASSLPWVLYDNWTAFKWRSYLSVKPYPSTPNTFSYSLFIQHPNLLLGYPFALDSATSDDPYSSPPSQWIPMGFFFFSTITNLCCPTFSTMWTSPASRLCSQPLTHHV